MSFKFFDLSQTSLDEWKIVYSFCLQRANYFKIGHMYNYPAFEKSYSSSINDLKILNAYGLSFSRIEENINIKKEHWTQMFLFSLEKSDLFRMYIPQIESLNSLVNSITNLQNTKVKYECSFNNKKYVQIYGSLSTKLREILIDNLEILYSLQLNKTHKLELKLIDSEFYRNILMIYENNIGLYLTEEELEFFNKINMNLNKDESMIKVHVNGTVNDQAKMVIYEMSILLEQFTPTDNNPYFYDIKLYKDDRELLFNNPDERLVCFSNDEMEYLAVNENVDISKWNIFKEKDTYTSPYDFFLTELNDL